MEIIRRAASNKRLQEIKHVDFATAKKVRELWHGSHPRSIAMRLIDKLIECHGVEYLGQHKRTGEPVYYCNSGDAYATTIVFHGDVMHVACWADYVETGLVKTNQ